MKQKLYFECYAGISGDMAVAALLDLGASLEGLKKALKTIPIEGFQVNIKKVKKEGLDVYDFEVVLDKKHENYDHDMEYLHKQSHNQKKTLYEHHIHEHRHLQDIEIIIDQTKITKKAKEMAKKIFRILAEAEAKAHGVPPEKVHFHEVGASDSIVDIIAVAVCMEDLGVTDAIVPGLYEGKGMIRCQHGLIPIPVPATLHIVSDYKIPMHILDIEGELITPTGAAIIAALRTEEKLPSLYKILKTGMGAGKRNYETTGILRVMLIEEVEEKKGDL